MLAASGTVLLAKRLTSDRLRGVAVVLAAALLVVGCGPSEREKVERAAKTRWQARSGTCTHRSGNLYGCVLLRAHIPLRLQFADDYLSSKQHRCFRADRTIVDVSTTPRGYACTFGRAS
jgi:hypothetical protein